MTIRSMLTSLSGLKTQRVHPSVTVVRHLLKPITSDLFDKLEVVCRKYFRGFNHTALLWKAETGKKLKDLLSPLVPFSLQPATEAGCLPDIFRGACVTYQLHDDSRLDNASAEEALNAIISLLTSGEIVGASRWRSLAKAYEREGDLSKSIEAYQRADSVEPHGKHWNAIAILYRKQRKFREALAAIKKGIAIEKGTVARSFCEEATIHRKTGHYKDALNAIHTAIDLEKKSTGTATAISLACKAEIYIGMEDFELASETIELAIRTQVHPRSLCIRAFVRYKQFKYDEALADIYKALQQEPREPRYHMIKALILSRLNRTDEANESLKRARSLERRKIGRVSSNTREAAEVLKNDQRPITYDDIENED